MPVSPLDELLAEYAKRADSPPRWPRVDDRASLIYYREELAAIAALSDRAGSRSRVAVWIRTVRSLEEFVSREGRLPRENNRLPREQISTEEKQLAEWVRYQRRPATRADHCRYQSRRLESIPGFSWGPRDDQWNTQFTAFAQFVAGYHHAPRYRSEDLAERASAAWAAKQRHLLRLGKLPKDRAEKLASLSFRVGSASTQDPE